MRRLLVAGAFLVLCASTLSCSSSVPASPLAVGRFAVADDLSQATVTLAARQQIKVEDSGRGIQIRGDTAVVPLSFAGNTIQSASFAVTSGSVAGTLSVEYYPRSYYESIGATDPGVLILNTDLPRAQTLSIDARLGAEPTPTDRMSPVAVAWAEARSSGAVPLLGVEREQGIGALYSWFDAHNRPNVGPLCDQTLNGYETMASVRAGTCWVWCTGFARILRGFLRSDGVAAREVTLLPQMSTLSNGIVVQSSEAHATNEWWDGHGWLWIDPTLRTLGAQDETGAGLSTQQLITGLADPTRRAGLSFIRWDAATEHWTTTRYGSLDPTYRDALGRFLSTDKRLIVD